MGILYTSDVEDHGTPLGTIAAVMGKGLATVWRCGDDTGEDVDFGNGRKFVP